MSIGVEKEAHRSDPANKVHPQFRGTCLIKKSADLGPCRSAMNGALWWSSGGGLFLVSEVPLHHCLLTPGSRGSSPALFSYFLRTDVHSVEYDGVGTTKFWGGRDEIYST